MSACMHGFKPGEPTKCPYCVGAAAVGGVGPPDLPEPILQFFDYQHLPTHLAAVSQPFCALAHAIFSTLPRNPERTVALRKLLEAKDAAVRARLYKEMPR